MSNKNSKLLYIFLSICLILIPVDLLGYDNGIGDVHDTATRKAWVKALQERYFLQDLGLTKDDILYENKNGEDWIAQGSRKEDEPIIRSANHFYDPVKKIGLNDACGSPIGGYSSPFWALGYVPLLNAWDIKNAREYEYIALTGKNLNGSSVSDAQDDTGRHAY